MMLQVLLLAVTNDSYSAIHVTPRSNRAMNKAVNILQGSEYFVECRREETLQA